MKKIIYIFKEVFYLVKRHKLYFLLPIFVMLTLLAILVGTLGAKAVIAFIYAGI